jgi:hypothetical protein
MLYALAGFSGNNKDGVLIASVANCNIVVEVLGVVMQSSPVSFPGQVWTSDLCQSDMFGRGR